MKGRPLGARDAARVDAVQAALLSQTDPKKAEGKLADAARVAREGEAAGVARATCRASCRTRLNLRKPPAARRHHGPDGQPCRRHTPRRRRRRGRSSAAGGAPAVADSPEAAPVRAASVAFFNAMATGNAQQAKRSPSSARAGPARAGAADYASRVAKVRAAATTKFGARACGPCSQRSRPDRRR